MKPFILIIEDDPVIADNIRYILEREGSFIPQIAPTGKDGLSIALGNGQSRQTGDRARSTPDLIVLDLNLSWMSGFELCHRFRAEEEKRRMPIIMLTARTEEVDNVRGLVLCADDYITLSQIADANI
ncbi:MAG: response regulator [Chloracidobacterium sp.]|nr:response regulator [Chloracidobacterium sp.]